MFDFYVKSTSKKERLQDGPFREALEPLANWLYDQGFSQLTGVRWFGTICKFNDWFNANGYRGKPVTEGHVCRYLEECSGQKNNPYAPPNGKNGKLSLFPRLFALMRERQKPTAVKKSVMAFPKLLNDFETHLADWYGASKITIKRHRKRAEEFHVFAFGKIEPNWGKVEPAIVLDFVRQSIESNPKNCRYIIGGLRCYFRYLQVRGYEIKRLLEALPRLYRQRRPLPERLLSPKQIKRWLAGFDRSNPEGLRNYAMALCFADLGIRIGDLVRLCLKDVDWRNGTIRIANSKTGRSFWLPLPARTGKAIAKYLQFGRPNNARKELFLRHKAPINEPLTKTMIHRRMKQVAQKQGIPWFGVHVLRHTAATRMRAGGASLKNIADVLGHVNLNSTMIYAKIDMQELAKITQPWPEVRP